MKKNKLLRLFPFLAVFFFILLLVLIATSCENELLEIEEKNLYSWQKYMNEDEYNQLEKNMSYMEVVRIIGGAGEKIATDTYEWNDEILLTRGYIVQFKENKLVKKEIIERKGDSTR